MGEKKVVIAVIVVVLLLAIIYIPGYLRIKRLARQNFELEQKIEEITQANERLTKEHQSLLNDPIYLENVAREKLGVAREGEIIYKINRTEK